MKTNRTLQVWSDLKNNTKRKWAKIRRAVQGTGGGSALKMTLSDLENRVMAIMGLQAAVALPIPEIGFRQNQEESIKCEVIEIPLPIESLDQVEPAGTKGEDWNIPATSQDESIFPPLSPSPPIVITPSSPPKPTTPSQSPRSTSPLVPPPGMKQKLAKKKKLSHLNHVENLFLQCEINAREANRERDRMMEELERERIRQRDMELQLQAEFLKFLREAMNVIVKYLDKDK